MKQLRNTACPHKNNSQTIFASGFGPRLVKAFVAYILSFSMVFQPVFAAGIAPSGGNTNMGTASNGVPVLNIDAPTKAGVSHNKFNDFNVGEEGLIINNLNMQNYNPNYKSSLSGEHVEFNYNFRTGDAAKVILNEVISNSVSELKGTTEIYGQKADYIVANPNGITCAGCGFINTGRLSLITGSANMINGDIDSFNMSGTGILRIDGVGVDAFGMYAPSHADLVSNAIRIAGDVHVNGDLSLYSGNDKFDYKNKIVSSNDTPGVEIAVDSTALGGMKANNIRIVATQKGFGINTNGNLVADMGNVEITADGDIVVKNVAAVQDVKIKSVSGNMTANDGDIYAHNINIDVAKDFKNDAGNHIVAQKDANIVVGQKLTNIGKLNAGNSINLTAGDVHNYGQILTGRNLTFVVDNDLINYRGAGILSGGDITFNIGRDLINYKAEIYALGNITLQGRTDIDAAPSGLVITSSNMTAMAAKYDNPYLDAQTDGSITPPVIVYPDDPAEDEFIDTELLLSNGLTTTFPSDAFDDEDPEGTSYTNTDGYTFIIGMEITTLVDNPDYTACMEAAGDCSAIPEKILEYSYVGKDDITIKSNIVEPDGTRQNLTFLVVEPTEGGNDGIDETEPTTPQGMEDIPIQNGTGTFTDDGLDAFKSVLDGVVLNDNRMGTLLNWGGRIEAGGSIDIAANELTNKGFDINTGNKRVNKYYRKLRNKACSGMHTCGWKELGRELITSTNLDSEAAYIIAGLTLDINVADLLNQSSVISSGGDMMINADNGIKNQTYSEVETLQLREGRRRFSCKRLKCGYKNDTRTTTFQKRIYSKQRSMIISGGDLKLKSTTLTNDQVLDPLLGLGVSIPMPDDIAGGVSVDTRLPVGDNGLFHVVPDGKYLVETNVSFINPNDFYGSDYFFTGLGDGYSAVDTTRIIGDPAYETRLVMDAILKATGQHYLDNNGVIGSDTDQMKSLYDAAVDASQKMNLKVGIALTSEQIANLQQDIIWYVEKEVDGVKVLVPQLYLSQATLNSLDKSSGSKITGVSVVAENEYMVNVGTISSDTLLSLNTGTLINESNDQLAKIMAGGALSITADRVENNSAAITGDTVSITADELINKTKVLSEDRAWDWGDAYEKRHIEETSHTATISGTNGVDIDVAGKLHNTGATIESKDGDINISAEEVVFDTARLFNSNEEQVSKGMVVSSETNTKISQSLTNIGSEINAGGNLNITTKGDATFAGTTINAGKDAKLDVGGNTNVIAVMDESYTYEKTDKSSWFGLVKEVSIDEMSDQNLKSSSVNVVDGLTIHSGNNLNLVAREVNAGGNAEIYAGNNINILSAEEVDTAYSFYEKTNYLTDALKALGTLALAGATGGASLLVVNDGIDVGCSGGSCGASVEIGSQTRDENFTKTTTSVGSGINVGGDLFMQADNDINIKGSDIAVGGDGVIVAANNINVVEAKNSTEQKSSHEDTTISVGAKVGHAYVDAALAAKELYDAGDAVVKASENLKHVREAYERGDATYTALEHAELNLAMASVNLATAEMAAVAAGIGAATAAESSFGTGIYVAGSVDFDTNKTTNSSSYTESVGSNIFGENISFVSGNNMTQVGSNVVANDTIIYDIANDLNILASEDTYKSSFKTENIHAGGSIGNNAVQINAGYDQATNHSSGTTHTNSNVIADNIIINTGGDATFKGANVNADGLLAMDVGGDLVVESVQDTHVSSGNSWGVSVSAGKGYGTDSTGKNRGGDRSGGGGFHFGNSSEDTLWTTDQTELTGGVVDIVVDGKTTIKGGMIAAGGYDENGKFKDNGNLSIDTGELEFEDLEDHSYTSDSGFGFSTNLGGSTNKGEATIHPMGKTTITAKNLGQDTEQDTNATIGSGSIVVGGSELSESDDALAGLNRDVNDAQVITKDKMTGSLDSSVTIDNRVLLGWIEQPTYEKDENGNVKIDENGNPIPVYEKNEDGSIKTDANGNPIQATTNGWGDIGREQKAAIGGVVKAVEGVVELLGENATKKAEKIIIEMITNPEMTPEERAQVIENMKSPEMQNTIAVMAGYDKNESVANNIQNILDKSPELLDPALQTKLKGMMEMGYDDNALLANLLPSLYTNLIKNKVNNPMEKLAESFNLSLEQRDYLATVANLPRGCDGAGCGHYGASRAGGSRPHNGLDLASDAGDYAYAPIGGTVTDLNAPYRSNNGNLSIVSITNDDSKSRSFYIAPREGISVGSTVKQGDYIGTVQDLKTESPSKHGGKNPTPNHAHQEVIINGKHQDPAKYIYQKDK